MLQRFGDSDPGIRKVSGLDQQSDVCSRVRRDSRLGLDFSYFSVQISRLGLVSVSKKLFTKVSVLSRSRKIILQKSWSRFGLGKSFYRSLSLVSVSVNHFSKVSVSSRVSGFRSKISRKFQKKSITKVLVLKVCGKHSFQSVN